MSLAGLGWCALGASIALVRVAGGFAVGVQDHMRSGGVGAVWPTLRAARVRAGFLAKLHRLPVLEAI